MIWKLVSLAVFAAITTSGARADCPALFKPDNLVTLSIEELHDDQANIDLYAEARAATVALKTATGGFADYKIDELRMDYNGSQRFEPTLMFTLGANEGNWVIKAAMIGALETAQISSTFNSVTLAEVTTPDGKSVCRAENLPFVMTNVRPIEGGYGSLSLCLTRRAAALESVRSADKLPFFAVCRKALNDSTFSVQVLYVTKDSSEP